MAASEELCSRIDKIEIDFLNRSAKPLWLSQTLVDTRNSKMRITCRDTVVNSGIDGSEELS
jgi:hypothetical protein